MKNPRPRHHGRWGFFVPEAFLVLLIVLVGTWSTPTHVRAGDVDWTPLLERLIADGFDKEKINDLFIRPDVVFESDAMSSKLGTLIRKKFLSKPSDSASRSFSPVYEGYLRPEIIAGASSFLKENTAALENITNTYCVPKEVVVSIMLVETRLGENMGSKFAFNTLASMALCTDLETILPFLPADMVTQEREAFARQRCRLKADWAYQELKALIRYAEKSGIDPLSIPGSIYGAIGLCQFMPSNVPLFGIDADGDGRIDLFATADALHSIANYLNKNGWKCKMNKRSQHRIILTYNKSHTYANTVLAIAEKLKASKTKK